MSKCCAAAIDVELFGRDAQFLHRNHRNHRKRLIDLEQVNTGAEVNFEGS
jgi:predicted MarR family transcription regulator